MPGLRGHASARTTLALLARAVELPLRVPSGPDVVLLHVFTTQIVFLNLRVFINEQPQQEE